MNPKKIEDLNPATTLQDDDLLFASVRQGGAIYASKKVTLKDIADYVRNGTVVVPGGSESGSGFDTMDSVQLWENGPYWATKNIGAKRDIDFGEYFQYGSLNGYRLENNVWVGNGSNKFSFDSDHCSIDEHTKSQLVSAGVITDGNVLTSEHDAATQKFGSQWKIPSSQEWLALNEHCDMLWTEKDGVKGVMITGKGNYSDKSIFLPDAGYANYYGWSDGFNWYSSTGVSFTVDSNKVNAREYAYHVNGVETANPGDINIRKIYVDMACPIYYGLPIRPIKVVS